MPLLRPSGAHDYSASCAPDTVPGNPEAKHGSCIARRQMPAASELLKRLECDTQSHHARGDAPWRTLVLGDVSRAQYTAQLARLYGFESPFEGALAYTPELPSEWRHRTRSGLIA